MRNQRICVVTFATFGVLLRAIGGILVAVAAEFYPEANALALFDIPTIVVYLMAALVGLGADIVNASDILFFSVGLTTWGALGASLGLLLCRRRA